MARLRRRRQVRAESDLRFNPQRRALAQLLSETQGEFESQVRAEEGTARGLQSAAREARRPLTQAYQRAGSEVQGARSDLEANLGRLGPGAAVYQGASAREGAAVRERLATAMASALKELSSRETDAAAGRAQAVRAHGQRYVSERAKIGQQLLDLEADAGTFAQGRESELAGEEAEARRDARNKAADRRTRIDAALIGQGVNPETGERDPSFKSGRPGSGRGGDGYKRPRGEATQQQKIRTQVENARSTIKQLKRGGDSYSDIRAVLRLPKSKDNPYGLGVENAHIINAAINLEQEGFLGPVNERRLRGAGLYAVPRTWKKRRRPDGPIPRF